MSLAVLVVAVSLAAVDDTPKVADELRGSWVIVSLVEDGKPEERAKGDKMAFAGGKLTLQPKGEQKALEGSYRVIDASKKPKAVNVTLKKDQELLGIYQVEGDTLTLCLAEKGKDRPTEFKATADWVLVILKRDKP